MLNEKVSGGSLAIKIAIALSAFGNMIAVAFTSSKGTISYADQHSQIQKFMCQ